MSLIAKIQRESLLQNKLLAQIAEMSLQAINNTRQSARNFKEGTLEVGKMHFTTPQDRITKDMIMDYQKTEQEKNSNIIDATTGKPLLYAPTGLTDVIDTFVPINYGPIGAPATEADVQAYEADYMQLFNDLDALKIIIEECPKTLWQKCADDLTPIFFALNDPCMDDKYLQTIKTIVEAYPQILEQEDENKNIPIIKIVELYDDNPSKKNKNLLQDIFELQFRRKLEDDVIENLVNFVRNMHLLKLIYEDSGQVLKENNLKKILCSTIISEDVEEDDLIKKLASIYQKICQEEIDEIIFFNKNDEKNSLHIFNSDMKDHSSYFIFHVNEKNKLTAISYCDGNEVYDERKIESTEYIYGATTYILKVQEDFSRDKMKEFIKRNFKEKDFDNLCEKISEINCLETIYSIPTKAQIKENCTFKSVNVLVRFLLEYQYQEKIFDFDLENSRPSGIGHKAYKKLKETLVQNASENLILSAEKLGEDFCNQVKLSENIKIFLEKSSKKKTPATRFSQSSVEKLTDFLTPNGTNLVC